MDMVTMNIIESTMVSICREMGITMMTRTSYPVLADLDHLQRGQAWISPAASARCCATVAAAQRATLLRRSRPWTWSPNIMIDDGVHLPRDGHHDDEDLPTIFNEGLDFTCASATRGAI